MTAEKEEGMAETPKISLRIDPELRDAAAAVFEEAGLNMTSGILVYLKTVVREGRIPFWVGVKRQEDYED